MVQNEIFKSAVFLLDHVHHWILLLINYSEKASEQFKNKPSLNIGELRDVLFPGHRIHDRRSRGRRSDLVKLPNKRNETFSCETICLKTTR